VWKTLWKTLTVVDKWLFYLDNEYMEKRVVNIYEYMPVLREILEQDKDVSFLITGNSMSPFLVHQRDTIIISKPKEDFKVGDMVFYTRESGQYIMHRVYKVEGNYLYMVGDAQVEIEGPLPKECVFGIVKKVIRKNKLIDKSNFWFWFFENIWIRIVPFRKIIVKLVTLIRK